MKRAHARENSTRAGSSSSLTSQDGGVHSSSHDTAVSPLVGPQISRVPIAETFSTAQATSFLQRSLAGMGQALARPSSDPPSSGIGIQAKLKIGKPGDKYEQEADRVADQIMSMPEPRQVQRQATSEEEEEPEVSAKLLDGATVQRRADEEPEEEEEEPDVSAKPLDGATIQRQADEGPEEEEEPEVSAKPMEGTPTLQRQADEEEEEPEVSAKLVEGTPTLQRQADEEPEEEEEPDVSAKPMEGVTVQSQADEEEEEPEVSAKPMEGTPTLQRQADKEPEEQEEPKVSAKASNGPSIQRQANEEPEEEEEEEPEVSAKPTENTLALQPQVDEEPKEEKAGVSANPMNGVAGLYRQAGEEEGEPEVSTELLPGAPRPEQEARNSGLQHRQRMGRIPAIQKNNAARVAKGTVLTNSGLQAQIGSLRGGGRPLPKSVRGYFESRFGFDFSSVRIHTDARAAEAARGLNARAFTVGRDVVFGFGHYAPGTAAGNGLLAHELTHTIQQGESIARTNLEARDTSPERETPIGSKSCVPRVLCQENGKEFVQLAVPVAGAKPAQTKAPRVTCADCYDACVLKRLKRHMQAKGNPFRIAPYIFLGQTVEIHPYLAGKLAGAVYRLSTHPDFRRFYASTTAYPGSAAVPNMEQAISMWLGNPRISSAWKDRKCSPSYHGVGLAVDFARNIYLRPSTKKKRRSIPPAILRATELFEGKSINVFQLFPRFPKRKAAMPAYQMLSRVNEALRKYTRLIKAIRSGVRTTIGRSWLSVKVGSKDYRRIVPLLKSLSRSHAAPDLARRPGTWLSNMKKDFRRLAAKGGWALAARGIMTLKRPLVEALTAQGLFWGGTSKLGGGLDLMHFDCRLSGPLPWQPYLSIKSRCKRACTKAAASHKTAVTKKSSST